jgi:opacity protein-like surface antigen
MKRLLLIALIALLLAPIAVSAQGTPYDAIGPTVPAESISDGWTVIQEEESPGYPSPWDRQIVYGGPEGSRVTVWLLELGTGLEWVSGSWGRLTAFWIEQAIRETGIADPATATLLTEHVGVDAEGTVSDTKTVEGTNSASGAPIAVSQYGSYDLRFAIVVIAEGTVNGLTGVAATDYVAGLYFAALSA